MLQFQGDTIRYRVSFVPVAPRALFSKRFNHIATHPGNRAGLNRILTLKEEFEPTPSLKRHLAF
jgi:hypothetical protein